MRTPSLRTWLLLAGAAFAAPATAQEPAPVSVEGNKLVLPGAITFTSGATLSLDSEPALAAAAAWLTQKDYISLVRVEAHTDAQGDGAANLALSQARALAVSRALVARGIDCKRLLPVGFGEDKPLATNDTIEGRAANRRVELHNAMLRGRAIGGMPVDGGGLVAGDPCGG